MELTKDLYGLTEAFPDKEKFGLINQIRRGAISVPSNIAEGWGRNSTGNFIQFLNIAKGSLCEIETQVILATGLGYCKEKDVKPISESINELGKMLKGLIASLEKNKG